MSQFFADTFYWIALANPRDSAHREVMDFTAKLGPRAVITTDEVLTELLAYCASHPRLRREVGLAVLQLQNDPDIRIVPQSRSSFLDGLTLYNARPDKAYRFPELTNGQIVGGRNLATTCKR